MYGMVAAGTLFRTYTSAQSYFFMDDFQYLARVTDVDFWSAVAPPYGEHLMPLQFAAIWFTQQIGAMQWSVAVLVLAMLWLALLVGTLKALREVFGERYLLLIPLCLLSFAPILTVSTLWYASALQALSWAVCFVWFLYYSYRYVHGSHRRRDAVLAFFVMLLGLLAWQKALSIAPTVAVLLIVAGDPSRRAVLTIWRMSRQFILSIAALLVGYFLLYLAVTGTGQATNRPSLSDFLESFLRMIGTTLVPALFGFNSSAPIVSGGSSELGWPLLVSLWAIALLFLFATVYRRPGAAWVWVMLLGYSVVVVGVFTLTRLGTWGVGASSDARYVEDLFVVAVIALMFAWFPAAKSTAELREIEWLQKLNRRSVFPVLGGALLAVMIGASWSVTELWSEVRSETPRQYVANARDHLPLADGNAVLDGPVPDSVETGIFEAARASVALKGLKIPVDWDGPAPGMGYLTDEGVLAPIRIGTAAESQAGPTEGCGWLVNKEPITVPLTGELYGWNWVIRIQYLAAAAGSITVKFSESGSEPIEIPVQEGLNDSWLAVTGDGGAALDFQSLTDAVVCVDKVTIGERE
jgi:hypothetical protein